MNFKANWTNRASGVNAWKNRGKVICPPSDELSSMPPWSPPPALLLLGLANDGVLNRLKTSARNCSFIFSRTEKSLKKDMLIRSYPGPYTESRRPPRNASAAEPDTPPEGMFALVPGVGLPKAQGLYQFVVLCMDVGQTMPGFLAGVYHPPCWGSPPAWRRRTRLCRRRRRSYCWQKPRMDCRFAPRKLDSKTIRQPSS